MRPPTPQYQCSDQERVAAVRSQTRLNGIEYLEVDPNDQTHLRVFFVHALPGIGASGETPPGGARLAAENVRIDGGVRVRGIRVLDAQAVDNVLTVTTSAAGDFSTHRLRLVVSDVSDDVPVGYDPRLAAIDFSFKAGCASEFDCETDESCPPEQFDEPVINYRAKDYASFRRLMLDRLVALMPDWRDRGLAADPLVTSVEALALTADHLSYWQDAVATEAYLGTARSRISVRRHARLLDYPMHDGCNARTWVHFTVAAGGSTTVPTGTIVLTRGLRDAVVLSKAAFIDALSERPTVFATMHDVSLDAAHNAIALYTWSDTRCCLPKGAVRATLVNAPPLTLQAGDWLLFEEVFGPKTGVEADADLDHRQIVRLTGAVAATDSLTTASILEVSWDPADALRFPLCLDPVRGLPAGRLASVARGNLVLADHGIEIGGEIVTLERVAADRPPRARLREPGLTFAAPFDAKRFVDEAQELTLPADQRVLNSFLTAAGAQDATPDTAVPSLTLASGIDVWQPRRDLLASGEFDQDVVVEMDNNGTATLRFGDNEHGVRPPDNGRFVATYRLGNGRAGNVGADSLGRVVTTLPRIENVRNPLPAFGGIDPESIEAVRQFAPQAFRRQERAVTTADWAEVAQRDSSVQRAAAQFRWTGSWHTVFVAVDRKGGLELADDPRFAPRFRSHLDRFRLAGYDLELENPVFVPLDVKLVVCVRAGYFASDVKEQLIERFDTALHRDGTLGFFHPDNFTFGQSVYLSRIYETAMRVPGVSSLRVARFQRFGMLPAGELAAGRIDMSSFEVARLDNDPSRPENGRLEIEMEGGS